MLTKLKMTIAALALAVLPACGFVDIAKGYLDFGADNWERYANQMTIIADEAKRQGVDWKASEDEQRLIDLLCLSVTLSPPLDGTEADMVAWGNVQDACNSIATRAR